MKENFIIEQHNKLYDQGSVNYKIQLNHLNFFEKSPNSIGLDTNTPLVDSNTLPNTLPKALPPGFE